MVANSDKFVFGLSLVVWYNKLLLLSGNIYTVCHLNVPIFVPMIFINCTSDKCSPGCILCLSFKPNFHILVVGLLTFADLSRIQEHSL